MPEQKPLLVLIQLVLFYAVHAAGKTKGEQLVSAAQQVVREQFPLLNEEEQQETVSAILARIGKQGSRIAQRLVGPPYHRRPLWEAEQIDFSHGARQYTLDL